MRDLFLRAVNDSLDLFQARFKMVRLIQKFWISIYQSRNNIMRSSLVGWTVNGLMARELLSAA